VSQSILFFALRVKARNSREGVAGFRRLRQVFVAVKANRNSNLGFSSIGIGQLGGTGDRTDNSENAAATADRHALA
jgi:hypothetical protein